VLIMRIQLFSDRHDDVLPPRPMAVSPDVDAVIVAGDTCEGAENAFEHLRRIIPMQIPILMVMGNHEYYRRDVHQELISARRLAPLFGIHLLENGSVVLGNVRFVGATLWTAYDLCGPVKVPAAMRAAAENIRDHKRIGWTKRPWRRFRPSEALLMHSRSRRFIAQTLAEAHEGPNVVITHHAPHPRSLDPEVASDLLAAAYATDLSDLIEQCSPDMWVHGHVHRSSDYKVGGTRIVCNPHGYGHENRNFHPELIIEIGS
jgi:Icc-related predicted phosphoesterase